MGSRYPPGNDRCYDRSNGPPPERLAFGEFASAVVFSILLATALALAGYFALRLIERDPHGLFGDPVWHEPLESWNL